MRDIKRLILSMFIFAKVSQTSSHPTQCAHKRSSITLGIYEVLRNEMEQNMGEGRAEPFLVYPLLYSP